MQQGNSNHSEPPVSANFLREVFDHLPALVVLLAENGRVLAANPAATRITGYEASELTAENWWSLMFPGKLFAQVPKFVALTSPGFLRQDFPMALRTKSGRERIVAFSRFYRPAAAGAGQEMICIGVDLTDRLTRADCDEIQSPPLANDVSVPMGIPTGDERSMADRDAGDGAPRDGGLLDAVLEGIVVDPIAVLPPAAGVGSRDTALAEEVGECTNYVESQVKHLTFDAQIAGAALAAAMTQSVSRHAGSKTLLAAAGATNALSQRHSANIDELARQFHALGDMCRKPQNNTEC